MLDALIGHFIPEIWPILEEIRGLIDSFDVPTTAAILRQQRRLNRQ